MTTTAPPSNRSRITVIIPTHARSSLLERTIESVTQCAAPDDRAVQICVVENGSREGVEQLLEKMSSPFPLVYCFHAEGNKSAALNSVLPQLRDDFIIFLDDDVRVHPQLLRLYAAASQDGPGKVFFGGGVLIDYERVPPAWLLRYLPPSAKGWNPPATELGPREHFFGCNWAAYAAHLLSIGGFDANFGPGARSGATGQETVMQKRLRSTGLRPVYLPDAVVWHYVPAARCSPDWALQRARKMAASVAMRIPEAKMRRIVLGRPLWLYRELLESLAAVALSSLMNRDKRFAARFRLSECRGAFDGLQERRRRESAGNSV